MIKVFIKDPYYTQRQRPTITIGRLFLKFSVTITLFTNVAIQ